MNGRMIGTATPARPDRVRQVVVTAAEGFCVLGRLTDEPRSAATAVAAAVAALVVIGATARIRMSTTSPA